MKTNYTSPLLPINYPAISVVIPMYNAEGYVGECLDSLLLQTFQDFEVIVVDDCSTDDSVKIVKNYAPKFNGRLRLEKTEKNSGGGGYVPRNTGMNFSHGKYVYFLDADDFILLTALETLYNKAEEYKADVVYMSARYMLTQPNEIRKSTDVEARKLIKRGLEDKLTLTTDAPAENLEHLFTKGNFLAGWTKFIRRDFLVENKISFPDIMTGGDYIWGVHVYCCSKRFLRLPIPLYFYRDYDTGSVTKKKREPLEQISYWVSSFAAWSKTFYKLINEMDVLKNHPNYCYKALEVQLKWTLNRVNEEVNCFYSHEIYDLLCTEFAKENDLANLNIPFLFSTIVNREKTISKLKNNIEKEAAVVHDFTCPTISVIIPMYNAEKCIGECLDSLLAQTFQNFEVIVVDDCSTDNSAKIVKSYAPKFNTGEGIKLTFTTMEKNTGSGALPRNEGLLLARGEYVQFLDADDMLIKSALNEMYVLAKKYNADVVYCEKYFVSEGFGQEFLNNVHIANKKMQNPPFVDKPTFETENMNERFEKIQKRRFWGTPWNKFVRRNLIIRNKIFFPKVKIAEDEIWTQGLIFYAKKILRVPNIIYIRRISEDTMTGTKRTPQQEINFWINPVLLGLKSLDNFMNNHEFFQTNPSYRYTILEKFINNMYKCNFDAAKKLDKSEIFSVIRDEFAGRLGEYDVLIPALCSVLYTEKNNYLEIVNQVFIARLDIKFMSTEGNFQIISISDDKASMKKPSWINKDGTGYVIRSYAGKIEVVVKSDIEGKINLQLKARDVRDPKNNSKRIPYWIDYTKLAVNDKVIFDKLTPVWHDKPYRCNINVNADEKIRIQAEWQPHLDERTDLSAKPAQIQKSETSAKPAQIQKSETSAKPAQTQKSETSAKPAQIQKSEASYKSAQIQEPDAPKSVVQIQENNSALLVIDKFKDYLTARVDLTLTEGYTDDLQIFSISDDKAAIKKPAWLQKDGICYQIESYAGNMEIVAKAFADGQLNISLKGIWVPDPEDKSKRLRYWIDFTKCIVNGEVIFDKITPVWNGKPYVYNKEVKSGEEIKINVEWQPHRGKA